MKPKGKTKPPAGHPAPKVAIVEAELKRIARQHGGKLHAVDVLEAARPARAILHPYFEWRDEVAGEKFRLWQAQTLIRITVELIDVNGEVKSFRSFVSLSSDRQGRQGYRSITAVLSNPAWRAQLLADALGELRAFKIKYRSLSELVAVFDAADSLL